MSVDPKAPGGSNPGSSGTQEPNPKNPTDQTPETVSYETHRKLLGEKKKRDEELAAAQTRLQEFEKEKQEREEAEATKRGDFETALKLKEEENRKLKTEHETLRTSLQNGQKLRAMLNAVNGDVDEAYWSLFDLSKITMDPATNLPEPSSVKNAAAEFEKTHALVIQKASAGGGLPNDAAKGAAAKLTYTQWLALPDKDKPARIKDVDKSTL